MTTLAGPEQQLASLEGAHVLFRGLWGQFDAIYVTYGNRCCPRLLESPFVLCDLGQGTIPLCASISFSIEIGQMLPLTSKGCCD